MWIPAALVVVMGMGAWWHWVGDEFSVATLTPHWNIKDVIFWSVIIFAFGGSGVRRSGGEIQDAQRRCRTIFLAGLTITACHVIGTFCVLVALPNGQVSNLDGLVEAIERTAERLGGWHSVTLVAAVLIVIGNIGGCGVSGGCGEVAVCGGDR